MTGNIFWNHPDKTGCLASLVFGSNDPIPFHDETTTKRQLGRSPERYSSPGSCIHQFRIVPPARSIAPHDGVDKAESGKDICEVSPNSTKRLLVVFEYQIVAYPPLRSEWAVHTAADGAVNEESEVSIEEPEECVPGSRIHGPGFDPGKAIANIMAQGRQCRFVDNCESCL